MKAINKEIFKKLTLLHRKKIKQSHFNDEKLCKEHHMLEGNLDNLNQIKNKIEDMCKQNHHFTKFMRQYLKLQSK